MKTTLGSIVSIIALSFFAIIIESCSCKSTPADNNTIVQLKPDTSLSLTDIVDASEWINIEANDSDYLGDLSKLEILDGDFYVLDKINLRCVLRFSQNGELLNKIGSSGAGPGEYPAVLDFSIDRLNKQVMLLSMQSTLYIYSSDGEFIKKVKLDDGILNAISANSESMIASSGYAGASNGKDC